MVDGSGFVPLRGSDRAVLPAVETVGPIGSSQRIEVTIITRRRAALPSDLVAESQTISQGELSERYGSDPADITVITTVLTGYGLDVTHVDLGGRRATVAGPIGALEEAFGTSLRLVQSPHPAGSGMSSHRYREGGLRLPAELDGIVVAVLGLDDRPQARPHMSRTDGGAVTSYTPAQVADIYNFPAGFDGAGQTLALIELGGGFSPADLDAYFAGLGLATPSVTAIGIDGGDSAPRQDLREAEAEAEAEVAASIEIAGAAAPAANQVVYFAPNTDRGFVNAVTTAIHATPTPTAMGINWGNSESAWTPQARNSLHEAFADAAALGITVIVAAGNNGSSDGVDDGAVHVDFPASSPNVLACGGTSLEAHPVAGRISETVWNSDKGATGGGVSEAFAVPPWQASVGVPADHRGNPGRGVPDVAGNADPATGYEVFVRGQQTVTGGTSAATALWAGLLCRLSQASGRRPGAFAPVLYEGARAGAAAQGFHSIINGDNGGYSAGPGWDPCTGLGSPDGNALLRRLTGQQGSVLPESPWAELESQPAAAARRPQPQPRPRRSQALVEDDVVRRAFADLVQPGRLLFNPPDEMTLGQTELLEVRLTRTLERDIALGQGVQGPGKVQIEDIPTAPIMTVSLTGDGFKITPLSAEEQSVSPDGITTWQFKIQACKRGQQRLVMSVSLRVPLPGQPARTQSIPVREATISVNVRVPSLVWFAGAYWQWVIPTAITLAGVIVAVVVTH